jgi:hypothetical protein
MCTKIGLYVTLGELHFLPSIYHFCCNIAIFLFD